jgi:glycerol-3-phosphate dehydrogenase
VKERHDKLAKVRDHEFDLVVIGGGINGAGVAHLAAASGLKVLLLEKNDFAFGASGNTNKLLHGYFHYLQQLQLNISKQEFEGRETIRRLAPHLVQDVSFVLPLARNNLFFNMKAAVGNTLYETLRLSARKQGHAFLSKKKLSNMAPVLSLSNVLGGIQFTDTTVDDARLVIAVLKAAENRGAIALNYVQVSGFELESGKISGVKCRDRNESRDFVVKCKACVNASGIWANELAAELPGTNFEEKKYVDCLNLIVKASAFETNAGLILPGEKGDFVFVFPWEHCLLIGVGGNYSASETNGRKLSDREEIVELLERVNRFSNSEKLNISDVKSYFRSQNPLLDETSSVPTDSAKIMQSNHGLISISGGVLGDYQHTADETMQQLSNCFPNLRLNNSWREEMLGGWADKESYLAECSFVEIKAKRLGLDPSTIEHLSSSYGAEAAHIVDLIEQQPTLGQRIISDFPVIEAEIPYAVISEMAVTVQDFVLRRTRIGVLNPEKTMEVANKIAETMAKLLRWDKQRMAAELDALESEIIWQDQEANLASR